MWTRIRSLWRTLRHRSSFEREMDDELRFHMETRAAHFVAQGLSPAEAARRARVEFGNPVAWQDHCREARGLRLLNDFAQDVRFAWRGFARSPVLSATVVLTLTFGIGVSSGVFTLLSGFALKPHVHADPATFARLHMVHPGARAGAGPFPRATPEEYFAFRDDLRTLRPLAAYAQLTAPVGDGDGAPGRVLLVTCNFFDVYGVRRAALGRLLEERDCASADPVVVLSDEDWRTRFAADPEVIGRVTSIKDLAVTIVGVAPRTAAAVQNSNAWVPYTLRPRLTAGSDPRRMVDGHFPHDRWLNLAGRLTEGATREQARAEAAVVAARQDRLHPGQASTVLVTNGAMIADPALRTTVSSVVMLVMFVLTSLLLIACANVATLLLSRADARQKEVAIRLSIGAGRARLLRMLLTETLVLGVCAGIASLAVARAIPAVLIRWLADRTPEFPMEPDWRVFIYVSAAVFLVGIVAGLAPALESMRVDVLDSLKGRRSVVGAGMKGGRLRAGLIATQVALSFVLLVGASLFVITHYQVATRDPGLDASQVMMPRISYRGPSIARPDQTPAEMTRILASLPGAERVVFASAAPGFAASTIRIARDGAEPQTIDVNEVSPGFFQALGIPILRGRPLDERDRPCGTGTCDVVVSASLVRRFLPDGDPLGRTLTSVPGTHYRIVGVSRDTSMQEPGRADSPLIYLPWIADGRPYQALVRFTGDGRQFGRDTTELLRARFTGASVEARTLYWTIERLLDTIGRVEILAVTLGITATSLAVMGVFGVVSFAASRRRHELGVRIALGATSRDIYASVIGLGVRPVAVGLLCGMGLAVMAAVGFARVLDKLQFTVSPLNPLVYAGAASLLTVVILAALTVPARRAADVSPLTALKAE
jgi:predicted permease